MLVMMNVDRIGIPDIYTHTPPRKAKIDNHLTYYLEHGTMKSNIVVTQKGMLVDGYCNYIVAVMCGISLVQCEINTKRISRHYGKNRKIKKKPLKRKILYDKQCGKCAICGRQLQIDDRIRIEDYLTVDHILPVARGGSNRMDNLQGLCWECNHEKQDYYMEEDRYVSV